ncbi:Ribosome biogenesis protein BRX1-like protein [Trichoplax sp. H2]|nr:Ribosome biogenesis protein BRX1-like protein [Trichoplax sp. H2]|eukprot:RDD47564.1 Ribosome biogenesis protein BRX1-like protein [Trichoplax sp. H2]
MGKKRKENLKQGDPVKKVKRSKEDHAEQQDENKIVQKWTNKQRILIFSARGITYGIRHLMNDLRCLIPHSKSDNKLENRDELRVINEICELKNCTKCLFFQVKKKQDAYLWISNIPHGPSAKFLVENVHTMDELKMTGNCLKGSRPIVSFDKGFSTSPHYSLLQELFTQVFSTPQNHPRSKPFVDHVFSFSLLDERIWFRNYQIVEEDGTLVEIGPRFTLNLIRIFDGSFGGPTLFVNPNYNPPNEYRKILRKQAAMRHHVKAKAKVTSKERKRNREFSVDEVENVFMED